MGWGEGDGGGWGEGDGGGGGELQVGQVHAGCGVGYRVRIDGTTEHIEHNYAEQNKQIIQSRTRSGMERNIFLSIPLFLNLSS